MSEEFPVELHGKIIVFGAKQIRRIWHDEQWFFSIVDIVAALTDSEAPSKYWTAMKRREEKATGFQFSTICRQLKLTAADGKSYKTEAVNTEAAFRIPSPAPRPSRLNAGWRKSVTNGCRRSKTRSLPSSACGNSSRRKATPTTGSRSGSGESPSATS